MDKIKAAIQLFFRWVELYTWRFIFALLIIACSILLVWEPSWIASSLDAMRIPYAIFLVAFTMFFFLRNNYAMATAGGIALLIIAPGIWRYFKPANELPIEKFKKEQQTVAADFSILHFNVKENNKKIETVAEAALASGADIVSMQELKPASFAIVDALMRQTYPYVYSELDYTGFGMALYAKIPFDSCTTYVSDNFPVLACTIYINDVPVRLFGATTSTPTNEKDFKVQAAQFAFMSVLINKEQGPVILMGDMNAVPWSEHIKLLMEKTGLKDSRKDLTATYPAQSPLQIPIDYIFHSKNFTCKEFKTVGGTTSNHLGLIGYYTLRDNSKPTKAGNEKRN